MLATISLLAALSQPQVTGADLLFKGSRLTCKDWAEAANYYIEQGEDQACASLLQRASGGSKRSIRAGLICRILFEPKGKGTLREPRFGGLSLPPMPLRSWPEYPLVQQDGVWFELDENYLLGGEAEPLANYIDYCRQNGKFRTEKVMTPTKQQATDAFNALTGSKRWTALHWSGGDLHSSYTYDRQWTVEILRSETRFIDETP